ncbi:MAG TPA: riboflavin synthase [Acidimicrobiia bacterium]|nr:riboflavin synthase [Acidimicrobiia bacterium]
MFTGIVESLGTVRRITDLDGGRRLVFDAGDLAIGLEVGDSIAVNGVCLTAVEAGQGGVTADVVAETLRRSNLGSVREGDRVNLERPMRADGRFDGHIVQGHVDATGEVTTVVVEGEGRLIRIAAPPDGLRYVVEKGSITVDGVSLTVTSVDPDSFEVALIPHTISVTTLGFRRPGDRVNLEFDVLAKYIERLLERQP